MISRFPNFSALALAVCLAIPRGTLFGEDWPMLGRDRTRNSVSPEKNPPLDWDVKTGRNIKWRSELGIVCLSAPVVANGLVWIGTNNGHPRDAKCTGEAGVLMCFRESDGKFLYQHVAPVQKGPTYIWAFGGIASSPLVEGNRMWLTNTLAEILCFDIGPLQQGSGAPRELWKLDQIKTLGIYPARGMMGGGPLCSIGASYGDLIYVITANGIGWGSDSKIIRSPDAPDLLCLNKNTGTVVWHDNSPGENIIRGEYGNPVVIEVNGHAQVIAPQGDGWLRSFDALTGELIWKFDINPKSADRRWGGSADYFMSAPVLYGGKLYIGSGQYVEHGEGPGRLCCIDPTRRGDISLELDDGPGKGKPNPNSGEVWHFDDIGRMLCGVAIHDGLVIAAGFSGFVFCLDAKTGRQYWKHDTTSMLRETPLIVDGKVYVADDDGFIRIFGLSSDKRVFAEIEMGDPIWGSAPVFANGVLYVTAGWFLYAIQEGQSTPPPPPEAAGAKP